MKKGLQTICALIFAGAVSAQTFNEKVIIVNGGKFETSGPYQDSVSVASYNTLTKQYKVFDVIPNQSSQALLIDGQNGYVASEKSIVKYNLKTETRTAIGAYKGGSPHSLAISGNTLLVGNWYGQADSFLYAYDATTLTLKYAVQQITTDAKSILVVGDTAYVAQNSLGTVDYCGGFGCYNDSIGQLSLVRVSTGAYLGTITLGEAAAGVNNLYLYGNQIITVNTQANSITTFNIASQTFTTQAVAASLGRGVALVNSSLFLEINGKQGVYSLASNSIAATNLTPLSYAAKTVYEPGTQVYYQTTTDYSSYGKLFKTIQGALTDSVSVGISPEQIGLYYTTNYAPATGDDYVSVKYTVDTLINVLANDTDNTFAPLKVTITGGPLIFGATATVDSATQKIYYTPAIGIVSQDTITYQVCDNGGLCSTAKLYINVYSPTGINDVKALNVAVYPNPFTNTLTVEGITETSAVRITDVRGEELNHFEWTKNETVDLSNLSTGVYVLHIQNKSGVGTYRIVKQ